MIPGIVVFAIQARDRVGDATTTAERELERTVIDVERQQGVLLAESRSIVTALAATLPAVDPVSADCSDIARASLEASTYQANVFVADSTGEIVCSGLPFDAGVSAADRSWFRKAMANDGVVLGDHQFGRITKTLVIVVAQGVTLGANGRYAVGASVDLSSLESIAARDLTAHGNVTIVDPSGKVLVAVPKANSDLAGTALSPSVMSQAVGIGEVAIFHQPDAAGDETIFAIDRFSDGSGATAIASVSLHDAIAPTLRDRNRGLVLLPIAALVAFLLALFVMEARIFRPLRRMRSHLIGTRRVGGVRTLLAEAGDIETELDQLAESIENREIRAIRRMAEIIATGQSQRTELAAAIHDDSIQAMTVIVLQHDLWDQQLPDGEIREKVRELRQLARDAVERLRSLALVIESQGDVASMEAAIRVLAATTFDGTATEVTIESSLRREPGPAVQTAVYLTAREALLNVREHADATSVEVGISEIGGRLRLSIRDDGIGFASERTQPAGHYGMHLMRRRIEEVGGSFTVESRGGSGAVIVIDAPYE